MENYTGADLFIDALEQYGISYVFGNPGTTELPIIRAISDSNLDYILGLHEDIVVGTAAGYAQTRRYHAHQDEYDRSTESNILPIGVVNLHIAPGLAHGLGNIYNSSWTKAPLLITAGNYGTDHRHKDPILSGDLVQMVQQYCKWSDEVLDVSALPTMLRRAVKIATTPPTGPVFLSLPLDVMRSPTQKAPERLGDIPSPGSGNNTSIKQAAEVIGSSDESILIVGDGVARSGIKSIESAVDFAESSGSLVYNEIIPAEINFPSDHNQWHGYVPGNGERARGIHSVDTVVFAGCTTHAPILPHDDPIVPDDTTCIDIGVDPDSLGKNHPADVSLVGDPGVILQELADLLSDQLSEAERRRRLNQLKERFPEGDTKNDNGSNENEIASKTELSKAIEEAAPNARIVDESITTKYVNVKNRSFEPQQHFANKGGGLGYGLPAAIGSALAEQQSNNPQKTIGLIGDGTYLYYPHSIYTAVRHDIDITIVVADNRNYKILKDNMNVLYGEDKADEYVGMDFDPPIDIPLSAKSHGAHAEYVEEKDEIGDTISAALNRPGPDVIDVLIHD